jgi:dihydrofolate reductase
MSLSLIAAVSENGVIGRGGGLPWRLPADLKRFKALTMGHTIVMGRRTFESIGRVLPGRASVVITRNSAYRAPGATVVDSLEEALRRAAPGDEVFVIGGEEVFRLALPRAGRLYLTLVHASVAGDASFPDPALAGWKLLEDERHAADERNEFPYSFRVYERTD